MELGSVLEGSPRREFAGAEFAARCCVLLLRFCSQAPSPLPSERPPRQSTEHLPIHRAVPRAASPGPGGSAGPRPGVGLSPLPPLQNANDFKRDVGRGRLTLGWEAHSASAFALPSVPKTRPLKYISLPNAEHFRTRSAGCRGPTLMSGSSAPTSERGGGCGAGIVPRGSEIRYTKCHREEKYNSWWVCGSFIAIPIIFSVFP